MKYFVIVVCDFLYGSAQERARSTDHMDMVAPLLPTTARLPPRPVTTSTINYLNYQLPQTSTTSTLSRPCPTWTPRLQPPTWTHVFSHPHGPTSSATHMDQRLQPPTWTPRLQSPIRAQSRPSHLWTLSSLTPWPLWLQRQSPLRTPVR